MSEKLLGLSVSEVLFSVSSELSDKLKLLVSYWGNFVCDDVLTIFHKWRLLYYRPRC